LTILLSFTASSSIEVIRWYACLVLDADRWERMVATQATTSECRTLVNGTVFQVGST
jgi:hypothetical protein